LRVLATLGHEPFYSAIATVTPVFFLGIAFGSRALTARWTSLPPLPKASASYVFHYVCAVLVVVAAVGAEVMALLPLFFDHDFVVMRWLALFFFVSLLVLSVVLLNELLRAYLKTADPPAKADEGDTTA
jgi:hypothetical protein